MVARRDRPGKRGSVRDLLNWWGNPNERTNALSENEKAPRIAAKGFE